MLEDENQLVVNIIGGPKESEIDIEIIGSVTIENLVSAYGPKLVFHPQEMFFLDNANEVLNRSQLQWGLVSNENDYFDFSFYQLGATNTSADSLMEDVASVLATEPNASEDNFRYFITIPDSLKEGDLSRATTYVRVLPNNTSVDLQFWLFYPYNGHGAAYVRVGEVVEFYTLVETDDDWIGRHYGDWEHATVRLSLSKTGPPELTSVYMSQHAGGYWYTPDQLEFENSHPIVYVARFTHANYRSAGIQHYYRYIHQCFIWDPIGDCQGHFDLDFCDFTGSHHVFQTWTDGNAEIFSSALPGVDIIEPEWLGFKGCWGQYLKNDIDTGIYIPWPIEEYIGYFEVKSGPTGPAMKVPTWADGDVDGSPV
jgi:hypothetical protein